MFAVFSQLLSIRHESVSLNPFSLDRKRSYTGFDWLSVSFGILRWAWLVCIDYLKWHDNFSAGYDYRSKDYVWLHLMYCRFMTLARLKKDTSLQTDFCSLVTSQVTCPGRRAIWFVEPWVYIRFLLIENITVVSPNLTLFGFLCLSFYRFWLSVICY